ncbi:MAG TPA: L,D-transpeptidase family protein [Candidatus Brocadiia bacterium]|nr:L,D-transpeptidase family protein [Candidatus Brocadiia bacterium]
MRKKTKRRLALFIGGAVVAASAYALITRTRGGEQKPTETAAIVADAEKIPTSTAPASDPPKNAKAPAQTTAAKTPPPEKPADKTAVKPAIAAPARESEPIPGGGEEAIKPPAVVEKAAAAGAAAKVLVEDVSAEGVQAAWDKAMRLLQAGNRIEARRPLTTVYRFGSADQRIAAREKLDEINKKLVFTPIETEGATIDTVKKGDNLTFIARRNGVTISSIRRVNGMKDDTVRVGQQLKIIPGQPSLEVDKTNFTLTLYLDGIYVKEYGVGLGKEGKTPVVECEIETMQENPDWYAGGQVIKFGEPGHEIGTRWMGFKNKPGLTGFGIHGTDKPETIGTESSQGCVRLRNEDVEELFDFVRRGTQVRIYEGKPLPRRPDFDVPQPAATEEKPPVEEGKPAPQ